MGMIVNFSDLDFQIGSLCSKIKDYAEEKFRITLTVGIGGVHSGLAKVKSSFKEAAKALDYRIIKGSSSIISFSELKDGDKEYYYPINCELQLINNVKGRKY